MKSKKDMNEIFKKLYKQIVEEGERIDRKEGTYYIESVFKFKGEEVYITKRFRGIEIFWPESESFIRITNISKK